MLENKPILDPDHELPAPHDMQLPSSTERENVSDKKRRNRFPFIFLLTLIGIAVLTFSTSIVYPQKNIPNANQQSHKAWTSVVKTIPTPVPFDCEPNTLNGTEHWKIYTNSEYQFCVSIPPSYRETHQPNAILFEPTEHDSQNDGYPPHSISFNPYEAYKGYLRHEYEVLRAAKTDVDIQSLHQYEKSKVYKIRNLTVGGYPAVEYIDDELLSFSYGIPVYDRVIAIDTGKSVYKFSHTAISKELEGEFNPLFQKMIKSISFMNNTGMCTKEAKLCPDGSSVGRVGAKCEFAACPK